MMAKIPTKIITGYDKSETLEINFEKNVYMDVDAFFIFLFLLEVLYHVISKCGWALKYNKGNVERVSTHFTTLILITAGECGV